MSNQPCKVCQICAAAAAGMKRISVVLSWWKSLTWRVPGHEYEGNKKRVSSFPFCLNLSHDPHRKRPLIDYYPTTRAAKWGVAACLSPVYLRLINTSVSIWQIIHSVWVWHAPAQSCRCLLMRNRAPISSALSDSFVLHSLTQLSLQ